LKSFFEGKKAPSSGLRLRKKGDLDEKDKRDIFTEGVAP
jgi:hypothetical protein